MSDNTPRLRIGELVQMQELDAVTINEAFVQMDALTDLYLLGKFVNTPPSSPADGDAYLLGGAPTGAWSGYAYKIAYCIDGGWRFYIPYNGLTAYLPSSASYITYDGGAWNDFGTLSASLIAGLSEDTAPDPAADFLASDQTAGAALKKVKLGRASNLAKSAAVTGSASVTSASFFRTLCVDASGGAATITMPASATADDWVVVRKKDSSANAVTVTDNGGTVLALLSQQNDEVTLAWWNGAWAAQDWRLTPLTQVFTASGTWSKPPLARMVQVTGYGAGAGGGSGRRGAAGAARFGGGGGSGGQITYLPPIPASQLSSSVTVTVAAGGAGGASVTVNDTDGNDAGTVGLSSFGVYLRAVGGGRGSGGTATTGAAGAGGSTANSSNYGWGAAGGASSATATAGAGGSGASAGGGGGGGISTANAAQAGNGGGAGSTPSATGVTSGAGGASAGANGANGNDIVNSYYQQGGGGGGGGAGGTTTGGAGGNGGNPGAGGGGGGAALNGNASGAGGNGGRGEIRVTTFF